jgi:hypothetical protein
MPIYVILKGKLNMPVPNAAAIIPNIADIKGVFGVLFVCCCSFRISVFCEDRID